MAVSDVCGTVEQADAISVNADVAINRALNDLLAFMVDFPDAGLPGVFGGLVGAGRGVDLALQFLALCLGGIIGALLRGPFLRSANVRAVEETTDAGDARGESAGKGEMR